MAYWITASSTLFLPSFVDAIILSTYMSEPNLHHRVSSPQIDLIPGSLQQKYKHNTGSTVCVH